MSELKVYVPQDGPYGLEPEEGGKLVEVETCSLKSDVDSVIAEKDRALEYAKALTLKDIETIKEKDKEIAELKQKLESVQATAYAESVDAGMRERRLRRLLWHAIALFCARSCEYFSGIMSHCLMGQKDLYERCEEKKNKYLNAMYKCRAKAEGYK